METLLIALFVACLLSCINWRYWFLYLKAKYLIRKANKQVKEINKLKNKIEYR